MQVVKAFPSYGSRRNDHCPPCTLYTHRYYLIQSFIIMACQVGNQKGHSELGDLLVKVLSGFAIRGLLVSSPAGPLQCVLGQDTLSPLPLPTQELNGYLWCNVSSGTPFKQPPHWRDCLRYNLSLRRGNTVLHLWIALSVYWHIQNATIININIQRNSKSKWLLIIYHQIWRCENVPWQVAIRSGR